jgi:hypothetical protein
MWLKVNIFCVWEIAGWVVQLLVFLNTSVLYASCTRDVIKTLQLPPSLSLRIKPMAAFCIRVPE